MPTLAEYIAQQQQSDLGLAVLVLFVFIGCVALVLVWRRVPIVQSAAAVLSLSFLPAITLVVSPALAGAALLTSLSTSLASRARIHLSNQVMLIGVLIVGLIVRLPRLYESLWFDEAFTATVGLLPIAKLPGAIAADVHPPLYFTFKWIWAHLVGIDPVLFRLPDLAFGVVTVYLLYRVTLKICSQRVALTAGLLCALMPAAIYYSVEARAYALLCTVVLWALLELIDGRLWRFALIVALLPGLHNLGWFYLGMFGLIALVRYRQRVLIPLMIAGLIALPNMALALTQSTSMTDGYWLYFTPVQALWFLLFNLQAFDNVMLVPIVLPYLTLLFLSVWSARRLRFEPTARMIAALVIGVPFTLLIVSYLWMPLFLYRGMLPVMLLLLIPVAYAMHNVSGKYFRPLVGAVVVMALLVSYSTASMVRPDYASMIEKSCGGARVIYATSIPAAFVGSANSDRRILLWDGAKDNGQTLSMADMPAYDFHAGTPHGFVCVLQFDNPRAFASEQDYVTSLLNTYPLVSEAHYAPHRLGHVNIYVVMM